MIEYSVGVDHLSLGSLDDLQDAIYDSDHTLNLAGILDNLDLPAPTTSVSNGTTGDDTMTGGSVIDILSGRDGHDTLSGASGNDQLYGEAGNDVLNGGTGDDYMEGGTGNDVYVYNVGDGSDTLEELDGSADKISFGSGFDINDLTFARVGNNDLVITVDDGSTTQEIIIQNQFVQYKGIETIEFIGSPSFDLSTYGYTLHGTATRDILYGVTFGGGNQDTIYGGGGDDTIYGLDGDDTLHGEAGNDTIDTGLGNNTVYGGDGNDKVIANVGNDVLYGGGGNDVIEDLGVMTIIIILREMTCTRMVVVLMQFIYPGIYIWHYCLLPFRERS